MNNRLFLMMNRNVAYVSYKRCGGHGNDLHQGSGVSKASRRGTVRRVGSYLFHHYRGHVIVELVSVYVIVSLDNTVLLLHARDNSKRSGLTLSYYFSSCYRVEGEWITAAYNPYFVVGGIYSGRHLGSSRDWCADRC